MKYKKLIIYCVCIALIGSFIGVKLYTNKNKSNKSTVVTNDTQKSKTNTEVNNIKSTDSLNSAVSGTQASLETSKLDITMIDATPNTEGNTSGNLSNDGYFAKQGKWIYFTLPPTNSKQHPIYRAMSDGETGLKAITNLGLYRCISVIGDWVYYINGTNNAYIYRTKTDGSSTEVVVDYITSNMYIKDGFIYYTNPNGIFKLKLDSQKGTKGDLLAKGSNFYYIYVIDNLIFTLISEVKAIDPSGKGQVLSNLYTMNLNGTNLKKLTNDNLYKFIIYSGYVFYINLDNQGFYRMKLNGSSKIQLSSNLVQSFNIYNNNIYFSGAGDNGNNIYKCDINGKDDINITNNFIDHRSASQSTSVIYNINIIDDYIFYLEFSSTDTNLYRTKLDGSLERQLN